MKLISIKEIGYGFINAFADLRKCQKGDIVISFESPATDKVNPFQLPNTGELCQEEDRSVFARHLLDTGNSFYEVMDILHHILNVKMSNDRGFNRVIKHN